MFPANAGGDAQFYVTVLFWYFFFKHSPDVKLKNVINGATFVSCPLNIDIFFTAFWPFETRSMFANKVLANGVLNILAGSPE
jgi:hypothetical protein